MNIEKEREAFEAWASKWKMETRKRNDGSGRFADSTVQAAWLAWSARSQSQPAPQWIPAEAIQEAVGAMRRDNAALLNDAESIKESRPNTYARYMDSYATTEVHINELRALLPPAPAQQGGEQ